ncbi:MAG: hypothetical protein NTZ24_09300, partial [Deltaproteobacteria bacterium]|nr:hypothetical protein [Deltaproteobacteria bacterium]
MYLSCSELATQLRHPYSFHVAQVQLAKFIKTYALRLSTILTANEVIEYPATVENCEGDTTFRAFSFKYIR